jgi:hypothetical protein
MNMSNPYSYELYEIQAYYNLTYWIMGSFWNNNTLGFSSLPNGDASDALNL